MQVKNSLYQYHENPNRVNLLAGFLSYLRLMYLGILPLGFIYSVWDKYQ
jgi:hypothetical protein